MKRAGFFVTGTDTGVGKTLVTAALVAALRQEGFQPGVMKPFETGGIRAGDAQLLKRAAAVRDPLEMISPYRFAKPLSPLAASLEVGRSIRPARVLAAFKTLAGRHPLMLVEGIGGILVPLTYRFSVLDLAARFGLPLLIVSRAGLGTVNQTLLTLQAARRGRLKVAAVLLNDTAGVPDPSLASNRALIRRLGRVPVWGPLPHLEGPPGERIRQAAAWLRRSVPGLMNMLLRRPAARKSVG